MVDRTGATTNVLPGNNPSLNPAPAPAQPFVLPAGRPAFTTLEQPFDRTQPAAPAGDTITIAATVTGTGPTAYASIFADGQQVVIQANSYLFLGTGADAEPNRAAAVTPAAQEPGGATGPYPPVFVKSVTAGNPGQAVITFDPRTPLTKSHAAGAAVYTALPGNPGPQAGTFVLDTPNKQGAGAYAGVVPFVERVK